MSSSYQNYVFEVLIKTNNSQTFVQITKEKSGTSCLSQNFFSDASFIEAFGLFWGKVKFFFQVLQYFSRFLPPTPLFFQVFQVWPYFSRFSRFSRCSGNPDASQDTSIQFPVQINQHTVTHRCVRTRTRFTNQFSAYEHTAPKGEPRNLR